MDFKPLERILFLEAGEHGEACGTIGSTTYSHFGGFRIRELRPESELDTVMSMLAFSVSALSHSSYETNKRFLVPTVGGGQRGQETEYAIWIETECEVLLKGGVGEGREERKGAKESSP